MWIPVLTMSTHSGILSLPVLGRHHKNSEYHASSKTVILLLPLKMSCYCSNQVTLVDVKDSNGLYLRIHGGRKEWVQVTNGQGQWITTFTTTRRRGRLQEEETSDTSGTTPTPGAISSSSCWNDRILNPGFLKDCPI